MGSKRFSVFFERHIGLGLRWQSDCMFPFELSLAFMCVTINIGFGKAR